MDAAEGGPGAFAGVAFAVLPLGAALSACAKLADVCRAARVALPAAARAAACATPALRHVADEVRLLKAAARMLGLPEPGAFDQAGRHPRLAMFFCAYYRRGAEAFDGNAGLAERMTRAEMRDFFDLAVSPCRLLYGPSALYPGGFFWGAVANPDLAVLTTAAKMVAARKEPPRKAVVGALRTQVVRKFDRRLVPVVSAFADAAGVTRDELLGLVPDVATPMMAELVRVRSWTYAALAADDPPAAAALLARCADASTRRAAWFVREMCGGEAPSAGPEDLVAVLRLQVQIAGLERELRDRRRRLRSAARHGAEGAVAQPRRKRSRRK